MIGRRGPREVAQDVKVNIVDPITFGVRRCVKGRFEFMEHDPFAVHVSFFDKTSKNKPPVTWCFGRELLITGTTMPEGAGHGDISIWPLAWDDFRSYVGILLGNGAEAMTMVTAMKPIRNFIKAMERLVPLDHASDRIDMDKELIWIQEKLL